MTLSIVSYERKNIICYEKNFKIKWNLLMFFVIEFYVLHSGKDLIESKKIICSKDCLLFEKWFIWIK